MIQTKSFHLFYLLLVFLIIGFLCSTLFIRDGYAWEYPVKSMRITSLFGESRLDHFHNGIDFANKQPIYPVKEGEVIFYYEESARNRFLGIGNHMVVEHQNGIRSYYYHLEKDSLVKDAGIVTPANSIAVMGDSGKSFGNHLHLTMVDSQERKILNPFLLLPTEEDRKKPIIESVFFTIQNRPNVYKIKNRSIVNYPNSIRLFLTAGDVKTSYQNMISLTSFNARGLKRIEFRVDDELYRVYDFDYLMLIDTQQVLKSGNDFQSTYGLPFNFLLGDFLPTKTVHNFKINIEDWGGNQASKNYNVIFRL